MSEPRCSDDGSVIIDSDGQAIAVVFAGMEDRARELTAAQSRVAELEQERYTAISMLAEWCIRVDINGTGWDDWDESYKDAMHRPCAIRELLDAAIAKERRKWKEEYGRE